MTRLATVLIAVCVALGAAYFLLGEQRDSLWNAAFSQQTGYVVFTTQSIVTGAEIQESALGRVRIPLKNIPKLCVSKYSDVIGRKATRLIPVGSFLTMEDFTPNPLSCAGAMKQRRHCNSNAKSAD